MGKTNMLAILALIASGIAVVASPYHLLAWQNARCEIHLGDRSARHPCHLADQLRHLPMTS